MINVAVGWLLYERTGDPWSLGLVGVAELTPVLFLMVIAGNAADRYPRRNIGIFAHAVLTLAAVGLALLSWLDGPTWAIYALLFMVGTARAFASPSVNTILPQLLPAAEFANANAWLASTFQLAAITGPAIGGMLIAATGAATVSFALAAVGQFIFILMLRTMPVPSASARAGASELRRDRSASEVFAGFRFVRANPLFLSAITLDLFAVLFGGAVALLPVYADKILHVGPVGLGLLRAAPGVGAAIVALWLGFRPIQKHAGTWMFGGVAVFGVCIIIFGVSTSFWLSLVVLAISGAGDMVSVFVRGMLVQLETPDAIRGRVSAVNSMFIGASNELGAFRAGSNGAALGTVNAVVWGGVMTLVVVASYLKLFPQLRKLDRFPEPTH
jgi:MFS family permease